MVVRVYLSGLRAPCMPRRCLRRLETRHPYHLGGVFWYGSSISIDLPPIFCVSRVLACYASVWGPEYLWTIALYWGLKIRNLLENPIHPNRIAMRLFFPNGLLVVAYFCMLFSKASSVSTLKVHA